MFKKQVGLVVSIIVLFSASIHAGMDATTTCLQLSLLPNVQLFSEDTDVYGLRLCLPSGLSRRLTGLDVGGWNFIEEGGLRGIQTGIANVTNDSDVWGAQVGICNYGDSMRLNGLQLGAVSNVIQGFKGPGYGWQLAGLVNYVEESESVRLQLAGFMNFNRKGDFTGVQVALFGNNYLFPFYIDPATTGWPSITPSDVGNVTGVQIAGPGLVCGFATSDWGFLAGVLSANVAADLTGVQCCLGGLNMAAKDGKGLQLGGLFNGVGGEFKGGQLGIGINIVGADCKAGQLAGLVNIADGSFEGVQLSALFNSLGNSKNGRGYGTGLQIGAINRAAGYASGLQIGVVNYAENLKGFQIGIINVNRKSPVKFLPVVNARF